MNISSHHFLHVLSHYNQSPHTLIGGVHHPHASAGSITAQVMRIEPKRYTDMNPSLTGGLDHPWVLYIIVCDVGTLRQRQSHAYRLSTTSIPRIHAHMHTSDDGPNTRPGARRAPALATASKRQKAEHTCVCALKRRYPHTQAAPTKPKGSPRASRRRLEE